MPAGFYDKRKYICHCVDMCCLRCYFDRKLALKCLYCGKTFNPRKSYGGKPPLQIDYAVAAMANDCPRP